MATGTHDLRWLATQDTGTVESFGEADVYAIIQREVDAHNIRYNEMAQSLMVVTTDKELPYGGGTTGEMDEVDEYGRVRTQIDDIEVGKIGLPLRKFAYAAGFTRDFLKRRTPAMAAQVTMRALAADVKRLHSDVRRGLFFPTNYTWRDIFVDKMPLEVKRLVNADGMAIPDYEGREFDAATHTHYLGSASWTVEAIDALIDTVREHGHVGEIVLHINATNTTQIAALEKFMPASLEFRQYGADVTRSTLTLDNSRLDNRTVGDWGGLYRVVTKPWVPANYVYVTDVQGEKPLAMRVDDTGARGLYLAAQLKDYPLQADYYEHYFGIGVKNRTNGAIGFMANATYTAPPV